LSADKSIDFINHLTSSLAKLTSHRVYSGC